MIEHGLLNAWSMRAPAVVAAAFALACAPTDAQRGETGATPGSAAAPSTAGAESSADGGQPGGAALGRGATGATADVDTGAPDVTTDPTTDAPAPAKPGEPARDPADSHVDEPDVDSDPDDSDVDEPDVDEPPDPNAGPYDAKETCSSGEYWEGFDSGSRWMMPGVPCIGCHRHYPSRAPRFTIAGTVFPTAHEPDKCFGVPAATGAVVIITDANGRELSPIAAATGGNFAASLSDLALPYRAKVVVGGRERVMLTPQTNGDCNACHTQAGAEGAPGRIIVP